MARAAVLPVFVLAVVVAPAFCNGETTDDRIQKICQKMYLYDQQVFCTNTLKKNLKSPDIGLVGLAQITIEQSLSKATNSHNIALGLLKTATGPAKNALATCESTSQGEIGVLKELSDYFFKADYKQAYAMVDRFPSPYLCNDGLQAVSSTGSFDSLVKSNEDLWLLVTMIGFAVDTVVNP